MGFLVYDPPNLGNIIKTLVSNGCGQQLMHFVHRVKFFITKIRYYVISRVTGVITRFLSKTLAGKVIEGYGLALGGCPLLHFV